jgi:hypothetical protein
MPPTNPTSSVITEQLTRALGERVYKIAAAREAATFLIEFKPSPVVLVEGTCDRSIVREC